MPQTKREALADSIPVRFSKADLAKLQAVSDQQGESLQTIIRMAARAGCTVLWPAAQGDRA